MTRATSAKRHAVLGAVSLRNSSPIDATILELSLTQAASHCHSNVTARRSFVEQADALAFTADYMFSSVSSAAAAVTGASANGRISWRLPDGRTYAEWEEGQNAPLPDPDTAV